MIFSVVIYYADKNGILTINNIIPEYKCNLTW